MESHAELYAQRLALIEKIIARLPSALASDVGPALRGGYGLNMNVSEPEVLKLARQLNALEERMVAEGAIDFIPTNSRHPI